MRYQEKEMNPDCRAAIVIPCLNEERTVAESLSSIVNATYSLNSENLVEIIVVDGGSTDSTVGIVNSYKEDFKSLHLVTEKKRGIGHARRTGARHALKRAAQRRNEEYKDFWLISTDADTKVAKNWLSAWISNFDNFSSLLIAGKSVFPPWFEEKYPNSSKIFNIINKKLEKMEQIFGVINLDGSNSAVERKAYAAIGPFEQPSRVSSNGNLENLAGEDWDLSSRARLMGLSLYRSLADPIFISPRRFEEDPQGYFDGRAYEKEFNRVDGDGSNLDVSSSSIKELSDTAIYRQCMHNVEKPLLVDNTLLQTEEVLRFLGQMLVVEIQRWITANPKPDLFLERNMFILQYLSSFHKEFGIEISNLFLNE